MRLGYMSEREEDSYILGQTREESSCGFVVFYIGTNGQELPTKKKCKKEKNGRMSILSRKEE